MVVLQAEQQLSVVILQAEVVEVVMVLQAEQRLSVECYSKAARYWFMLQVEAATVESGLAAGDRKAHV